MAAKGPKAALACRVGSVDVSLACCRLAPRCWSFCGFFGVRLVRVRTRARMRDADAPRTHAGAEADPDAVRGVANTGATVEERVPGPLGQRRRDGGCKPGEHVEDEANEQSVTADHPPQCAVGRLRAGSWYADSFRPDSTSAGLHIIIVTPRANPSPGQLAHAD